MNPIELSTPEDDYDRAVRDDIDRVGWSVLRIQNDPGEEGPEFAYSAGIYHTLGHPEVLVMGLDGEDSATLINLVGDAVRSGRSFGPGDIFDGIPGLPFRFVAVDESLYPDYVGYGRWLYRLAKFPLLQMVWADPKGLYPWEPGFIDALRPRQTILGQP